MTISAWGWREFFVVVSTLVLAIAVTMRNPTALCGGSPPTAADSDKPVSTGSEESHLKNSSQQRQAAADSPQSQPAERVIWLKFLGESDRSVPIALISDSDQAIDHFLAAQPKDSVAQYGSRVLASSAEFGCITKTLDASSAGAKKNGTPDERPLLLVSTWTATGEHSARLPSKAALEFLRTTEKCLQKKDENKPTGILSALVTAISHAK